MKYYQIVFSPTGGTERVAKAITQNWPQVGTIDLSAPDTKYADICLESDALAELQCHLLLAFCLSSFSYNEMILRTK